jgi:hypothetical protein
MFYILPVAATSDYIYLIEKTAENDACRQGPYMSFSGAGGCALGGRGDGGLVFMDLPYGGRERDM